jgi:F-type H+-transporting ATPase subunit gamma
MPGGQERILRRRIKSVISTKKITRAMELIAATRVVKAQQRAAAARPYSRQITKVIENLAAGGTTIDHPLLNQTADVQRWRSSSSLLIAVWPAPTTPRSFGPPNAR